MNELVKYKKKNKKNKNKNKKEEKKKKKKKKKKKQKKKKKERGGMQIANGWRKWAELEMASERPDRDGIGRRGTG